MNTAGLLSAFRSSYNTRMEFLPLNGRGQ